MDVEFVNIFISKQKALIDELQNKNLMAESKILLLQKLLESKSAELEELKASQPSNLSE